MLHTFGAIQSKLIPVKKITDRVALRGVKFLYITIYNPVMRKLYSEAGLTLQDLDYSRTVIHALEEVVRIDNKYVCLRRLDSSIVSRHASN